MYKYITVTIKDYGTFLLYISAEAGRITIRNIGGSIDSRSVIKKIAGINDYDDIAEFIRKTFKGCDVSSGRITHIYPSGKADPQVWFDKTIKMLSKNSEIGVPTIIDQSILGRARATTGKIMFNMTLNDHTGEDEKRTYAFEINPVMKGNSSINDLYVTQDGTDFKSIAVATPAEKFNYMSYKDGEIKFSPNLEVNRENWAKARQLTKISKVVRLIFEIGQIKISYTNDDGRDIRILHSDEFHAALRNYGSERALKAYVSGLQNPDDIMYYVNKGFDRMCELIATEFKPKEYKIQTTKDIDLIYGTKTGENSVGNLGSSCMNAENRRDYECAKQSKFYDKLDGVSVLYLLSASGELVGRALIWEVTADQKTKSLNPGDKFTFVDRIYGSEDFTSAVKDWAAKKGYWWKEKQTHTAQKLTNSKDDEIVKYKSKITKLTPKNINRKVPYFDTMKEFSILSSSKSYATLQLSPHPNEKSTRMPGTSAAVIIIPCDNCGRLMIRTNEISANIGAFQSKSACKKCATLWDGDYFIPNKKDIKLSFSSVGYKTIPHCKQTERLVSVDIDGKKVLFDIQDDIGITKFFSSKLKKPKRKIVEASPSDWTVW